VVQAANDKQQLQAMLNKLAVLPDALGDVETLLADSGYYSAANVTACAAAGIDPLVAMDRQPHHPSLDERFAPVPPAPENPTQVEAMAHRLVTPDGKSSMPCASTHRSQCLASSNRCWVSGSSCCAVSIAFEASGAW